MQKAKYENIPQFSAETIPFPGGEIILKLRAGSDASFPLYSGHIVRGVFLNLIYSIDPLLAEKLHESNNVRPYAIESIKKISGTHVKNKRNDLIIKKGEQIELKLKILDTKMLSLLIQHFVKLSVPSLNILNNEFFITDLSYKTRRVNICEQSTRIKINFVTPTYFSTINNKESMYFPDPSYFFMSLAKLWNRFNTDIFIPEDSFFKWLRLNAIVNDYATRTTRIHIGKNTPIKGFQGWVVYRFLDENNFLPWIQLLSKFGELSNVGGSRTAGLGVIRTTLLKDQK